MGLFNRLFDANRRPAKTVANQEIKNVLRVNPLCSNYENMFAQVRPLIDRMKMVRPYGIGRNGARKDIRQTPEIAVLDSPNEEMGWADFADAMFATWLTEDELNIHVWRKQNGTVYGYSILPVGCRRRDMNGANYFEIYTGGKSVRYTDEDVMTLRYSRSPRNLDKGVSPTSSVQDWAQIDDLVAQYQKAFFENGAVPATITFITASTQEKYNQKRAKMESGFAGAKNKNKTLYIWRQMLDDGATADEVEVKPIQSANNTMAIREIVDIINDRLNKSIGVSNFLLGDDSSAKYDNAELSDRQFDKNRVFPALMSFWSQFQHELDRITGGLGYGITFDFEIAELTDRLKTKADIASTNTNSLITLINAGATPIAAVNALGLGQNWLKVADGIYANKITNSTVDMAPKAQTKTKTLDDYKPEWQPGEEPIKVVYDLIMRVAEEFAKENPEIDLDEVKKQIETELRAEFDKGAIIGATEVSEANLNIDFGEDLVNIIENNGYELSASAEKLLSDRVNAVVDAMVERNQEAVKETVEKGRIEGWTQNKLERELQQIADPRMAELIARNETHFAINAGRYDLDNQIAEKYDLELSLEWFANLDAKTCDICREMHGKIVPAGDAFPEHLEIDGIQHIFEHSVFNDYGKQPNAHPNCRCTFNEIWKVKQ